MGLAIKQLHFSTDTIKPSLLTPHRNRYNLSLPDQFAHSVYIPLIFHYPNPNNTEDSSEHCLQDSIVRLKSSLSDTLTQYYPFAGRLNSTGSYIDCNDKGIEFQQVSFECRLSELFEKPEHQLRDFLYPKQEFICKDDSPLLVVRLNQFQCGGVSILVCMSHKLCDTTSFVTFMKSWAINMRRTSHTISTSNNEEQIAEPPHFLSHPDSSTDTAVAPVAAPVVPWTTRKFVFPNSKIAKLKATSNATTRVEALTSLLFSRAIAVTVSSAGSSSGDFTPIVLLLPANIRSKMIPPIPKTSIGNILWTMHAVIRNPSENDLSTIVEKIKEAKADIEGMEIWEPLVNFSTLLEFHLNNYKYLLCSSFCRMQLYEINLGWGNPCRVTVGDTMINNTFILMDTPNGDGIEAIVALDQDHMTLFQEDKQILAYSSS